MADLSAEVKVEEGGTRVVIDGRSFWWNGTGGESDAAFRLRKQHEMAEFTAEVSSSQTSDSKDNDKEQRRPTMGRQEKSKMEAELERQKNTG